MDKLKMHSTDITEQNIDKIAELFPGVITENRNDKGKLVRAIDLDVLRQELSDHVVEGPQERYHLDWPGKRAALFAANAPIAKTLRPVREESVDFDSTKNLFIEGDNLDALKLLQESYLGKVDLIYIDPPYNTGNDFIYNDDYSQSSGEYLAKSGQVDAAGTRLIANTESNGRFHSDWLSMMFPRLKLLKNLLSDGGVIFVSIDDNELRNLLPICDEIFGESNRLNTFTWVNNLKGRQISGSGAAGTKEHIVCYARNARNVGAFRVSASRMKSLMPTVFKGFNYDVQHDELGAFVLKNELHNTNSAFNEETRPNLVFDLYFDPETKDVRTAPPSDTHLHEGFIKIGPKRNNNGTHQYHAFRWSRKKVESESFNLEFIGPSERGEWKVYTKVRDIDSTTLKDLIMDISTNSGAGDIDRIGLDQRLFDYPKPVSLIRLLCEAVTVRNSVVLDVFAGSGTTAHAVMELNAADGGSRQFILAQIGETFAPGSAGDKAGFRSIAHLARERIRFAARTIREKAGPTPPEIDFGFRAVQIDTSNVKSILRTPDSMEQDDLTLYSDNVKPDRTGEDLLFQVLLDWGLELSMSIVVEQMGSHEIFILDDGALIACFDGEITSELVRQIAKRQPLRAVFRDSGFASDADRINTEQIFAELSAVTDVKVI